MRLFIDLDSLQIIETPGYRNPVNSLRFKRGDGVPLEIQFLKGNQPHSFPQGTLFHFAAKAPGDFSGPEILSANQFEFQTIDTLPVYVFTPAMVSELLDARFVDAQGNQLSEITLDAEISWIAPGQMPVSTATFSLVVVNDLIKEAPLFYGRFTARGKDQSGFDIFRTVVRSSAISQADADEKARRAAVDLVEYVFRTGDKRNRYLYQVRIHEEHLLKVICEANKRPTYIPTPEEIGRITENRYGAEVLNVKKVMFVDVDTAVERPDRPNEDKSTAPLISEEAANALLDSFCAAHPEFGFRVYRTFAGLRYLCTSGLFDPTSAQVKAILSQLNADQSYRALCKIQKCFRARLTPKPWRLPSMGTGRPAFRLLDFTDNDYLTFRMAYVSAIANFSTCHFLRSVGSAAIHPICGQIVSLHDERTNALANLPLA